MKRLSLLCLLLCGCIINPPGPVKPDVPPSKTDAIVSKAMKDVAAEMSIVLADAADAKYANAADAEKALGENNKAARKKAFALLDELIDDRIGGEKWDRDEASKLFRELSESFEKAAK